MTYPPPGGQPDPAPYGQPPHNAPPAGGYPQGPPPGGGYPPAGGFPPPGDGFPPAGGFPPGAPPQTGGFPPGGPRRPDGRGKTVAVIVVAVVVALVVCIGGAITAVAVLVNEDDEPPQASSAGGAPTETRPADPTQGAPGGPALDCRAVDVPDGKAVGRPDFARAARTGTATMTITTNQGALTVAMDRAKAPCTVASLEHLAGKRFYDNSPCHRLTAEGIFVLQCGDPTGTGSGGPDYRFTDENLAGARYTRGLVAMANAGPNTNGSQFFIIYRDSEIGPNYTVFGQVTEGLEVVDRVAAGGVREGGNGPSDGPPTLGVTVQSVTVG